jgi:uncharacterized hydrophobic protein (TIGR00271 family)
MAFHLRVVVPRDLTGQIVGVLAAEPGVTNLVVLPGAGRRPDGDAVQCDLRAPAANTVLRRLRALDDGRAGPVVVEFVDAVLGERPDPAAKFGIVQPDIAPVWDVVEAQIRSAAVYPPSFFTLLAIAGLIGAVGILINSDILIVGAMVVGPEYNAIMGVALGIDRRERQPVVRGLSALVAGFLAAIILTLAFGAVIRGSGQTPEAFARGVRPVADLISSPDLFSVVVAVLAGIVGVVSLTEARASALIGVFISVTTIPAAASIGLSIAYTDAGRALGSTYQLLLNVVVLIVVGAAGMRLQRALWRAGRARDGARLHLPDGAFQGLVDVLGVHVELLGGLLLRPGHGLLDRGLDLALADHDQARLAGIDEVAQFLGLGPGHPAGQVAADAADDPARGGRAEDGRREDDPDRRAGRDPPPGAVARGGLVLVLVDLAAGVLGDHGGVVRADQAGVVQVLDDLVVVPGGHFARICRDIDERAVGLGHGESFRCCGWLTHPAWRRTPGAFIIRTGRSAGRSPRTAARPRAPRAAR